MLATSPSPRSFYPPSQSPSFTSRQYRVSPRLQTTSSSSSTSTSLQPQQASSASSSKSRKRQPSVADLQTSTALASPPPAPKTGRRDIGTQYTPPDWPPTCSRSSLRQNSSSSPTPQPQLILPSSSNSPGTQQRQGKPQASTRTLAVSHSSADSSQDGPLPSSPQPTVEPHADQSLRVPLSPTLQHALRRPLSTDSNAASTASSSTNITDSITRSNSTKRPRHNDTTNSRPLTVLPNDYSLCPPKTLASIIASMLMRLIAHNDSIPLRDGHLTRFHSRAPPGISVHDYLARLTFHATLSPPILLSMVFFIDRLSSYYPKFIINSLTVHRFLITAATVASKGLSDSFWTNPVYARVGGVSVKELALLELELLIQCQWKIVPRPQDLVEYYRGLVRQSDDFILEEDAIEKDLEKVNSSSAGVEMTALTDALPNDGHTQVQAPRGPETREQVMVQSEDTP